MIDKIKELIAEAENFKAQSKEEIETFRIKYLGKKGLLNDFFAEFKNVANDQKKEFGQTINTLKKVAEDIIENLNLKGTIPSDIENTNSYWLNEDSSIGMYTVNNKKLIGNPQTPRLLSANFILDFRENRVSFSAVVIFIHYA